MDRRLVTAALLAAIVLVAGLTAYYFVAQPPGPCLTLGGTKVLKSSVTGAQFDAMTEYSLPSPSRWSNAIAVSQDGSVWFGEQSVPGVGHLFSNGTLVEYPWPSASHPVSRSCGFETSIWGVSPWSGMVWGTDGDQNSLVGINPQTGAARVINVSGIANFPYTLATALDGSLWFTSLSTPSTLGRVGLDYSVAAFHVNGIGGMYPAQVDFVNSSFAYMVTINLVNNTGGVYSFDPAAPSSPIDARPVGGGFRLQAPDSVTAGGGTLWVAQHGPASLAAFGIGSGRWTFLPTTSLGTNITTLPYFVSYSAGRLWFNEHYGNRIGFIDLSGPTMTEYSESNPPISNETEIGNDLTIAPSSNGLWFTSTTGNYIGFANASYVPGFSLSLNGGNSATLAPGGRLGLDLTVGGAWKTGLSFRFSDSETYTAVPSSITVTPSVSEIPPGSGPVQLRAEVQVGSSLHPGNYTLTLTVSDGLVLRSVFFFLTVS